MRKIDSLSSRKTIMSVIPLTLVLNFSQTAYAGLFDEFKKGVDDVKNAITDGNKLLTGTREASIKKDDEANQSETPISSSPDAEQLASSQEKADAGTNEKTNIYVTDPKLNVFRTVIEGAVRARNNTTEGLARFSLQPTKNVRYDPIKYDCRLLHWRETANPTSISDKSMNGDYKNLTSANIEFIGVQPTNEQLVCVFDEVKIVGTYKEELAPTNQPVTPGVDYGSRHIDSMIVSVFQFKQSDLQTCIDRFGADQAKSACNITTYRQTAPSIVFGISSDEINRIGLRSANRKTGYWKEGFTPQNVERLSGSIKVKLMNINMHQDRGELYFESLTILE